MGSGDFVESVLKHSEENFGLQIMTANVRREKFALAVEQMSEKSGFSIAELTSGGRNRELVKIRQILSFIGVKQLGLSAASPGRILGVSHVSILNGVEAGKKEYTEMNCILKDLH